VGEQRDGADIGFDATIAPTAGLKAEDVAPRGTDPTMFGVQAPSAKAATDPTMYCAQAPSRA